MPGDQASFAASSIHNHTLKMGRFNKVEPCALCSKNVGGFLSHGYKCQSRKSHSRLVSLVYITNCLVCSVQAVLSQRMQPIRLQVSMPASNVVAAKSRAATAVGAARLEKTIETTLDRCGIDVRLKPPTTAVPTVEQMESDQN